MKPLAAILLTLCLTAQADPSQRAQEAAVADVATTVMGLSLGAAEANPLGLALIPLTIGADEPGKEILAPVAITILGGLLTATLLDAFLTPLLFHRFGRRALERLRAAAAMRRDASPYGTPAETF